MEYKQILVENEGDVVILSLHNPEVRNALSAELRGELVHALEKAEEDDKIRAIIITGEGKAFSAGGDLSVLKEIKPLQGRKRLQKSHQLVFKLLEVEKPIIAAVNGAAAGAGFSLTLLCDFIFASEKAFFVQSFVNVGLIPDFAAIHFLPLLIGPQKAKEMMFTGDRISAEEAGRIGFVNRVVPHEQLMPEAIAFAKKLAGKSPVSIGLTKKMMHQNLHRELKVLLELEAQGQEICFQTEDFKEGVKAFYEKREPKFIGK